MSTFQVISRTAQASAPPKKRPRRISQEWSAVIRVVRSMGISALLFVALLDITGSDYTFILLPVFLSLFITGSRLYPFNMILDTARGDRSRSVARALPHCDRANHATVLGLVMGAHDGAPTGATRLYGTFRVYCCRQ